MARVSTLVLCTPVVIRRGSLAATYLLVETCRKDGDSQCIWKCEGESRQETFSVLESVWVLRRLSLERIVTGRLRDFNLGRVICEGPFKIKQMFRVKIGCG